MRQVQYLRDNFDRHEHITDIVTSPMSRTMSTALEAFSPAIKRGIRVKAEPDLQTIDDDELSGVGLEPAELAEKYKYYQQSLDLQEVVTGWNNKQLGRYDRWDDNVDKRVGDVLKWIKFGETTRTQRSCCNLVLTRVCRWWRSTKKERDCCCHPSQYSQRAFR